MKVKAVAVAAIAVAGILGIRVKQSNSAVVQSSDAPARNGAIVANSAADNPRIPAAKWDDEREARSLADGLRRAYGKIAKHRRATKTESRKLMTEMRTPPYGSYLDYYGGVQVRTAAARFSQPPIERS